MAAALWLGAAGLMAWMLIAGQTTTAMTAAPWLVLVSWIVYIVQWKPCLRVDRSGFEIVNGLRDHRIPFGKVDDVEVRQSVVIRAAGRKYVSWGAPGTPSAAASGYQNASNLRNLPFNVLPDNQRMSQPAAVGGRDEIAKAWQDARALGFPSSEGSIMSQWDRPTIAIGILTVLWAVTITLIYVR
ncbi:hypothetical protein [Arthrobacter sp. 2MCAF14]|uniref:hypothetical protein n=1 Tax=Arthrobacter sp. 2MCAF14 TaxID=3232982 RepID=UPI003F8F2917